MIPWLALALLLGGVATASDGPLSREQASAALVRGDLDDARRFAAEAVRADGSAEAWAIYARVGEEAGIWPLVRAEIDQASLNAPELALIRAVYDVRAKRAQFEDIQAAALESPRSGRVALATLKWEQDGTVAEWVLASSRSEDATDAEVRLRLGVYAATQQVELASAVAHDWMLRHPDRPDVLAALWADGEVSPAFARLQRRWATRVARRTGAHWDDPVYLFRAHVLLAAAGEPRADAVAARIAEVGLEPPGPRVRSWEDQLAETRRAVERARREERFDAALAAWEAHRSAADSFQAALEHARLLQVLEREEEAWTVALRARELAAGPVPGDAACLNAAAQAARVADAHGLVAELALTLGYIRSAREAAAVARAVDPHPRWIALQAQAEIIPGGEVGEALGADARVRAVVDTLTTPTDADAWQRRARSHEEAGELAAAFVAWVIARAHGADIGEALERTWDGVGAPALVAQATLEGYHTARRSYREDLAAIRHDELGSAPVFAVPVAPGPGLRLPDWEATTFDQRPIRGADFGGRPYVLAVWATWCLPCLEELPLLNREVHLRAKEGIEVTVVAISVDERQITFERRVADGAWSDLVLGWSPELASALGIDGLPTSFAVDSEGRILHLERGYSEPGVKRLLDHALDRDD